MKKLIYSKTLGGETRMILLDFRHCSCQIIDIEGVCYIAMFKEHDHLYELRYFLYQKKELGFYSFSKLKELYGAVQKLLQ